jgi:hypothetical protein
MAPKMYMKPPQAPPSFTATPTSLVEDAKAICGMYLMPVILRWQILPYSTPVAQM